MKPEMASIKIYRMLERISSARTTATTLLGFYTFAVSVKIIEAPDCKDGSEGRAAAIRKESLSTGLMA